MVVSKTLEIYGCCEDGYHQLLDRLFKIIAAGSH